MPFVVDIGEALAVLPRCGSSLTFLLLCFDCFSLVATFLNVGGAFFLVRNLLVDEKHAGQNRVIRANFVYSMEFVVLGFLHFLSFAAGTSIRPYY